MKTALIMLCLLLLTLTFAALAQGGANGSGSEVSSYLRSGGGLGLGLQPMGLLDPSRISFNHSYSMAYLSSGGQSAMRGLFMETIGYRLSNPLSLTLNLGYLHQPYSSLGPDGLTQGGSFVGGAALDWRPSKNMFLRLEVGRYPAGSPYGYSPYWLPTQSIPLMEPDPLRVNVPNPTDN
jgi:hypothetical protein